MRPQEGLSRLEELFYERLRVEKMEKDLVLLKKENQKLKKRLKKYEKGKR